METNNAARVVINYNIGCRVLPSYFAVKVVSAAGDVLMMRDGRPAWGSAPTKDAAAALGAELLAAC